MSTAALDSQNTEIQVMVLTDSPPDFVTFAQVKSINGPTGTANVIDVSDLQSTRKEKRIGLPDEGSVSLDIFVVPSEPVFAYVRAARIARSREQFQIVFTDTATTTWSFYGYVSGVSVSIGVDQPVNGTITIEIDGAITEA